jgi:hypothetical protein
MAHYIINFDPDSYFFDEEESGNRSAKTADRRKEGLIHGRPPLDTLQVEVF